MFCAFQVLCSLSCTRWIMVIFFTHLFEAKSDEACTGLRPSRSCCLQECLLGRRKPAHRPASFSRRENLIPSQILSQEGGVLALEHCHMSSRRRAEFLPKKMEASLQQELMLPGCDFRGAVQMTTLWLVLPFSTPPPTSYNTTSLPAAFTEQCLQHVDGQNADPWEGSAVKPHQSLRLSLSGPVLKHLGWGLLGKGLGLYVC